MTASHDYDPDEQLLIDTGLAGKGIALVKMEGRVFLRMSGMAEVAGRKVPYALVPEQGVLAKPSKWRKLDDEGRKALLLERSSERAINALREDVMDFVSELEAASEDYGFDVEPFLRALAEGQSSEPASLLFDRIRQRLEHAAERQREEQHAERTKQSINLAEYPASFDVARRLPRRFIALLGPTNSGKTHKAIEALAKADSGIYLAPLRLLALENYERLQAQKHNGKPLKVNLVTGEERRIEEGASHVASTVEMLDSRTQVEVAVIDEIQMLADPDRGAAWTAAVCGAPARTVYLVGAPEARKAVEALAERLECELEVHILKRKAPLAMEPDRKSVV